MPELDRPMTSGKTSSAAQVIVALILFVAALSTASSVFAPVAFALFIIALVWPLQKALQGVLPRLLALALSLFVMVVAFVAFGSLIVWAFGRVGRWIVSDAARFRLSTSRSRSGSKGMASRLRRCGRRISATPVLRAVQTVSGRLNSTMSFWLVVLVYVLLGLLEVEDSGRRLKVMRNRDMAELISRGSIATAAKIQAATCWSARR